MLSLKKWSSFIEGIKLPLGKEIWLNRVEFYRKMMKNFSSVMMRVPPPGMRVPPPGMIRSLPPSPMMVRPLGPVPHVPHVPEGAGFFDKLIDFVTGELLVFVNFQMNFMGARWPSG